MIGMPMDSILKDTPNEQSPFDYTNAGFATPAGPRTASPRFAGTSVKGSLR